MASYVNPYSRSDTDKQAWYTFGGCCALAAGIALLLYFSGTSFPFKDVLLAGFTIPFSLLTSLLYSFLEIFVLVGNSLLSWFLYTVDSVVPAVLVFFKISTTNSSHVTNNWQTMRVQSLDFNHEINYTKLAEVILDMQKLRAALGHESEQEFSEVRHDSESELFAKSVIEKQMKEVLEKLLQERIEKITERLIRDRFIVTSDNVKEYVHKAYADYKPDCPDCTKQPLQFGVDDLMKKVEELLPVYLREYEAKTSECPETTNIEELINKTVQRALRLYDADKTGMVDYALETSGGEILSTRCTENIVSGGTISFFGFPIWHRQRNPRIVIQPGVNPGDCWAFSGSVGFLVIKLSQTIFITGFTMEHIPLSLAPDNNISSAPKTFSVWGLKSQNDDEEVFLGRFTYEVDDERSLQYFRSLTVDQSFGIVELKIESNHGKEDYTCIYRFRVHGVPASN